MPLSDSLNRSTFFREIFKTNQPFTFNQIRDSANTGEDHMEIGTPSQRFAKKILFSFIDLSNSLDTLDEIPIFFSIKKIPSFYIKNGISEIQYYKYHLENHYIKISSIIDYTSHFVNDVHRLGIPERQCNVFSVTENLNIKGAKAALILTKFNSHFSQLKRKRNIIIHKGKHESEEIKSIDSTIFSSDLLKKDKILMTWFNQRRQVEIEKVLVMFNENNKSVTHFLVELVENLINPFQINYNFLRSMEEPL